MLPQLNTTRKYNTEINVMRGLNRSVNTGFSKVSTNSSSVYTEFKDMKNMCSDNYPSLRPRQERTRLAQSESIISNLLVANGGFIYLTDDKLFHNGQKTTVINEINLVNEHNLVLFGNNVIIFPEKLQFNLSSNEYEVLEKEYSNIINMSPYYQNSSYVTIINSNYDSNYKCSIDKVAFNTSINPRKKVGVFERSVFSSTSYQKDKTADDKLKYEWIFKNVTKVGDCIEDVGVVPSRLYMCTSIKDADEKGVYCDDKIKTFTLISNYYVKIQSEDIGEKFDVGDFVKISEIDSSINFNPESNVFQFGVFSQFRNEIFYDEDWENTLNDNYFKIYDKGEDYIIIKADLDTSVAYFGPLNVERVLPQMDMGHIIEVNNRLWGCSSENNEIYCCKQGDAKNWFAYSDGIASDSFAMTVGSEGEFTGIAKYNDSVMFFKENCILRIYGTKPSNYTLAEYDVQGIEKGSSKSAVWINGVLMYKTKRGIVQYSPGGQPQLVSEQAFGDVLYKNAVAGRHKDKYYVSLETDSGEYELMVYDSSTGLWYKEDETQMSYTATYNDILYYVDKSTGFIMTPCTEENLLDSARLLENGEVQREGEFEWNVTTGDLYDSDFDTKYISRLAIGLTPESGTKIKVLAQYSDDSIWTELGEFRYDGKKPRVLPVVLRRAEFLRLKIQGRGQCNIYGISITYSKGSDIR